jgi:hypothetical protein
MGIQSTKAGNSPTAHFVAVGDDSVFNGAIVYGFAIFRRTRLKRLIRGVKEIKKRFNIPENVEIHCKDLRLEVSREKIGLQHLSDRDVESVYRNVITLINQCDVLVKYGLAFEEKVRPDWSAGSFTLEGGDRNVEVPAKFDVKGILGIVAQACFTSRPGMNDGPSLEQMEIFVAPDATKVKFLGDKARQAHYWARGFNDMGTGTVLEATPNAGGCPSELFEIADVIAYTCSHAAHGKDEQPFFHALLSAVKRKIKNEFVTEPE